MIPSFVNSERGARIALGIKRSNKRKAQARIAAGLGWNEGAIGPGLRITQRALEDANAEALRQTDPLERAKRYLRSRGTIVFSMSVYDGPADQFVVGNRRNVPASEVIRMAGRR